MKILDWFSKKTIDNDVKIFPQIEEKPFYNALSVDSQEKSLNWNSFIEQINLSNSFGCFITKEQLKNIYKTEKVIKQLLKSIAKPFLTTKFLIKNDTSNTNNKAILFLENSIKSQTVHFENIINLCLFGNAYLVYLPSKKELVRLDPCLVKEKKDNYYLISNNKEEVKIDINDVIHFKTPSIFSQDFGDSEVEIALLNLMADRYGYEFINTFFIRGGNTIGIIETDTSDLTVLNRLISSLRNTFTGRKNTYSDKVLPKGAKWVSTAQKMSEMQILEILRQNKRDFASLLGVPPVLYGDTDGVNYANSEVQMELFYEQTILPYQSLYCSALENNARIKALLGNNKLEIDNSNIRYLSNKDKVIEQIPNLNTVLTKNEIRNLLGYDDIYEMPIEAEMAPSIDTGDDGDIEDLEEEKKLSLNIKKKDNIANLFESSEMERILNQELEVWINKLANNLTWSQNNFKVWLMTTRKKQFVEDFYNLTYLKAIKYYKSIMSNLIKKSLETDFAQFLVTRANDFLLGKIRQDGGNSFDGYSTTFTKLAFQFLINETTENPDLNQNDLATKLRILFGESYKSQANTIVRTELGHALSLATEKSTSDITNYAKRAKKTWNALLDQFTRDSHADINGETIYYDADKDSISLNEKKFSNGLRYPRDAVNGSPADVINCRCVLDIEILELRKE